MFKVLCLLFLSFWTLWWQQIFVLRSSFVSCSLGSSKSLPVAVAQRTPRCLTPLFFHKLGQPGTKVLAQILRSKPVRFVRNLR
ncbi:hypothetical protein BHE74_00016009 [Ensete ventricosum]|uniref:Secreted protein n=1 Tax=Ensete ventricosum TaxID=4639 RepID=A0A426ZBZ5_ENSVE|nr:hypothetical protein B296_00044147 [Ensete ventricosum]RWW75912.1 hypothetical protein BHE74_00016009 [Ensete ventricosum]RZR82550.1 hypothetical protein BHM03_00008999 [Ensete ventricosum]